MLLDAIKSKCSCMSQVTQEEFNTIWGNFVRFLSNITCWDVAGGTIEQCCRIHAIDLNRELCSYTCIQVHPYWKAINQDTVTVELRQYSSRGVNIVPLDKSLFTYDDIADKFFIRLDELMNTEDNSCDKNCSHNVLVMRYIAGYDLGSPEWDNLICHYLTGYTAIANNCMSVGDCANVNRLSAGASLVQKDVDTIKYVWEINKDSQEYFFSQLVNNFYKDSLGRYSLCGRSYNLRTEKQITVGKSK